MLRHIRYNSALYSQFGGGIKSVVGQLLAPVSQYIYNVQCRNATISMFQQRGHILTTCTLPHLQQHWHTIISNGLET